MTFKQLLQSNTWTSIASKFPEIYPNSGKNIEGFKTVFEKLKVMPPEETDISIVISKEIDDNEEYMDVSGLHNNPKNKEESYPQGIELTPWCNWLGMDISTESLQDFSEKEIIVHCLYEMTFVGFEEEAIEDQRNSLKKTIEDYKSMTEEEKQESTTSIEKLLEECRDGNEDI